MVISFYTLEGFKNKNTLFMITMVHAPRIGEIVSYDGKSYSVKSVVYAINNEDIDDYDVYVILKR